MVYFENTHATIRWDEEDRIASIEWHGFADGEDYRRLLNMLLELLEQKSASRILADSRKAKVVTPADQEWVSSTWSPRANKAGLRSVALLVPESMVAKMSLERMRVRYMASTGGRVQYFTDAEDAKKWLCSRPA
jgi:hypothetical protein